MEQAQGWMAFSGAVVAALGQWLNRRPDLPAVAIKLALTLAGLALYLPIEQPWKVGFMPWFENAWVWGLAVPGAASLLATVPGMATNSQK